MAERMSVLISDTATGRIPQKLKPINVVQGNHLCLFRNKYKRHKRIVWAQRSIFNVKPRGTYRKHRTQGQCTE
jgi:hypothetical protein